MSIRIIQERLDSYKTRSIQEEEMALREITQEVALNALFNVDFFKVAAFHGGTCLRIFYSLNRFSEDLDFALLKPNSSFELSNCFESLKKEFEAFEYAIEVIEREDAPRTVKNIFIKDDSIGKILNLQYQGESGRPIAIRIKLEIDTKPPEGAKIENKYHDFPLNFAIAAYDLPSLFAGKIHALLCRSYPKGRDWYDFLWYAIRKVDINFQLLSNAIDQMGPWAGKKVQIEKKWFITHMEKRIESVDWGKAKADVQRFLRPYELKTLELWNKDFFLMNLMKL